MPESPDDIVCISKVHPFLSGDDKRHYVNGALMVDDIERSQPYRRADAEALLARGRWHGLSPRIEERPAQ